MELLAAILHLKGRCTAQHAAYVSSMHTLLLNFDREDKMTHLFGSRPAQYVAWPPRYAEEQPRHSTPGQRVWGSGGNNGNYGNYGNNGNSGRCSHYENHGRNGNDMMGAPGNYRHFEGYSNHGSYGNYGNYGNNGNSGDSSRYINSGQNGNRSSFRYFND